MTRIKLADWLNKQGYTTTPEQITTIKWSASETENGAYPLWIRYNLKGNSSDLYMGCYLNLRQMTEQLKNGYELKVVRDKWNGFELDFKRTFK